MQKHSDKKLTIFAFQTKNFQTKADAVLTKDWKKLLEVPNYATNLEN